jgi:regulator of sigma E protease
MNFIYSILSTGLSFIIPTIVLLGVLIFIHELGHFLVAKYFNVKVEVFSLGFGPKIWKYVRGETTYCLSAIPFGGYVKMFGDELGGEVPSDLQNRSFLHKPIYQRICIALAGPIMNLFLAYFLFLLLSLIGEQVVAPKLGDLAESTPAYQLGFRSGDRVVSINDQAIGRWDELDEIISQNKGNPLEFTLMREASEEPLKIKIIPGDGISKNIFHAGEHIGEIEGFDYVSNSSLIAISDPKSIFGQLGFKTGDQITAINRIPVKTFRSLTDILIAESGNSSISFSVDRYGTSPEASEKPEKIKITWDLKKIGFPDSASKLGIEKPETFIGEVSKDSPAAIAGVQANDQIIKIDDAPIKTFNDIINSVSSFKEGQNDLKITVVRNGETKTFAVTPKLTEIKSEMGASEKRFAIGIRPLKSSYVEYGHWRAPNLTTAVSWSFKKTWQWTYMTVMSFVLVVQNKVSPKNLGGFISIGQMAQKSWDVGIDAFLRIMAIISLNLFILNLLPIPVLDGGHILLFSIEGIKGTPISIKKLEIAQQIGVFFLLSLLAFSLFNDVSRLFGAS